jgi:hypothetical protein
MQIVKIYNFAPNTRPNLLPKFCDFETIHTWNVASSTGGVTATTSDLNPFNGTKSIKVNVVSDGTVTKSATITSSSNQMETTITKDGVYAISLMLGLDSLQTFLFGIELWVNGIKTDLETNFTSDYEMGLNYNALFQTIQLEAGDVVNYKFKVESKYTRTFYIDGFKLELVNDNVYIPSAYSKTPYLLQEWQSRVDTTNTQSIVADTDVNFGFVGISESNNNPSLLSTSGLITPINEKDVVTVDYSFQLTTPSGSDKFVQIFFKVNGIIYRAETHLLIKPTAETDYISGSFTLPVGADFKLYGGQIVINSSVAITIENRYISVINRTN